ncbi:TVP38/TMEM64 family protein [Bacillus spongiae]|uniref:TVP38/TMEM64 family membrane protein n=1 Tax=Bacillus spongiae TaxID=2683610 RepID=A0ABU8HEG1_9BACI
MKVFVSIILTLTLLILFFIQKDSLLEWIHTGGLMAILVSVCFVSLVVFFPIIPYPALAGIIGSVFGLIGGTLISLTGVLIGSTFMFYLSRSGFRDWAQGSLKKYPKVEEYEHFFEKNAFFGILFARLIPVIPSPAVNIVSGLSKVKPSIFFFATLLGKIPAIITFTFAGSVFEGDQWTSILIYGIYFFIITMFTSIHLYKKQAKMNYTQ